MWSRSLPAGEMKDLGLGFAKSLPPRLLLAVQFCMENWRSCVAAALR